MKILVIIIFILNFALCKAVDTLSFVCKIRSDFEDNLTGNWDGFRDNLEDKGILVIADYEGEFHLIKTDNNNFGSNYSDNFNIGLNFDFERLLGWKGAELLTHILGNDGNSSLEYTIGASGGISNIAVEKPAWKIYELYLNQKIIDSIFSISAGFIDLNSIFDVKPTGSIFLIPTHGTGIDLAQTGKGGPSIFPTTSFALRFELFPVKNMEINLAVYDAWARDIFSTNGAKFKFNSNNGLLLIEEISFFNNSLNNYFKKDKTSFGFWYYTDNYSHIVSNITNWGVYALFDRNIFQLNNGSGQSLNIYGRIGYADEDANEIDFFAGAGITYRGLIPGLNNDELGIGLSYRHNSQMMQEKWIEKCGCPKSYENIWEFTYTLNLTRSIIFQPDILYIMQPNYAEKITNDWVYGGKLIIVL